MPRSVCFHQTPASQSPASQRRMKKNEKREVNKHVSMMIQKSNHSGTAGTVDKTKKGSDTQHPKINMWWQQFPIRKHNEYKKDKLHTRRLWSPRLGTHALPKNEMKNTYVLLDVSIYMIQKALSSLFSHIIYSIIIKLLPVTLRLFIKVYVIIIIIISCCR